MYVTRTYRQLYMTITHIKWKIHVGNSNAVQSEIEID